MSSFQSSDSTISSKDMNDSLDGFDFNLEQATEGEVVDTLPPPNEEGPASAGEQSKKKTNKRKSSATSSHKGASKKGQRKRAVSDDDRSIEKQSVPNAAKLTTEELTTEDFINTIDEAVEDGRIDCKKADRLRESLQAGDWSQVAYSFMCENIPLKRNGKGYSCRVCEVPKKGHRCLYCHVCSTPAEKYRADDKHNCINCTACFNVGKKNKKLVQIECKGHVCPHGATC